MKLVENGWRAALVLLCAIAAALFFLPVARAHPALQSNSCLNAPVSADPTATVCISNVIVPFNGQSDENQFVVSWRTPNAVEGRVKLSTGKIFDDVRGADFRGTTHYIAIRNLEAKKNYTFDVLSGGNTFTNGGGHWTVRLGNAVATTTPYIVRGRVKNPDGSEADGALVFAQVRDGDDQGTNGRSALLSAVIVVADGGDFFNINLQNARTQNNSGKFIFDADTDRVLIVAQGAQGTASKQFKISDLQPPKAPPSLTLGSGTGNVATATPTLMPSATPTPSPTFTETATPSVTVTHTFVPPTKIASPTATDTPAAPPTFENVPTIAPDQATRLASTPNTTSIAMPAGEEVEPERTRVFGGVPNIQPPAPSNNNTWITIAFALVLFVGAILLGLAAFFVSRR